MLKELILHISAFPFRDRMSISSAYIIWFFIFNCSIPPRSSLCLLSSLRCLNLLLPRGSQIRAYPVPLFHSSLCERLCLLVCVHTQSCVSPHIFSNQILATFLFWVTKRLRMPVHVPAHSDLVLNQRNPESMFSEWRQLCFHQLFLVTSSILPQKKKGSWRKGEMILQSV